MGKNIYRSEDYCRDIAQLNSSDSKLLSKLSGSEVVLETNRFRPEPETFIGIYHLKPEQVTVRFVYTPHISKEADRAHSAIILHGSARKIAQAEKRIIGYLRENRPAPISKGHKGYREAQVA